MLDYITIKECPREFLFLKINYKILLSKYFYLKFRTINFWIKIKKFL